MRSCLKDVENRRGFFRTAARCGLLALLGGVAALTTRKSSLPNQRCINEGLCRACAVFADCGLPQALSAREVQAKTPSDRRL